jgi:hypothetical protein
MLRMNLAGQHGRALTDAQLCSSREATVFEQRGGRGADRRGLRFRRAVVAVAAGASAFAGVAGTLGWRRT